MHQGSKGEAVHPALTVHCEQNVFGNVVGLASKYLQTFPNVVAGKHFANSLLLTLSMTDSTAASEQTPNPDSEFCAVYTQPRVANGLGTHET